MSSSASGLMVNQLLMIGSEQSEAAVLNYPIDFHLLVSPQTVLTHVESPEYIITYYTGPENGNTLALITQKLKVAFMCLINRVQQLQGSHKKDFK